MRNEDTNDTKRIIKKITTPVSNEYFSIKSINIGENKLLPRMFGATCTKPQATPITAHPTPITGFVNFNTLIYPFIINLFLIKTSFSFPRRSASVRWY